MLSFRNQNPVGVRQSGSTGDLTASGMMRSSGQDLMMMNDMRGFLTCDLIERDNDFALHVDLPGVKPEDLDISIKNNHLILKAERKCVVEETKDTVHTMERCFGKIQREMLLPSNVDADRTQTTLKDGVLRGDGQEAAGVQCEGMK